MSRLEVGGYRLENEVGSKPGGLSYFLTVSVNEPLSIYRTA